MFGFILLLKWDSVTIALELALISQLNPAHRLLSLAQNVVAGVA